MRRVVIAAVAMSSLLALGTIAVAAIWLDPTPHETAATLEIQPGKAFELEYRASGTAYRLYLDLDCEACSLPVGGTVTARAAGGDTLTLEISAGEDADFTTHETLTQQLLGELPAVEGAGMVVVRGTLDVAGERGVFDNQPRADAPPPGVRVFRLTVAR